ncbi:hypothetical protein SARC_05363 [Sphaeroforma arctica JP610]|uniref:Uncharacterized protein n=1 Tax=Sphaeroforma arctica JP610 TaxID=667725 RepID=A0A0L0G2C9_9EUKA|nr:hypothetical protein SARC_05363 [Sphaeroforma arctica JP610]KNC82348.1 hypothetical protein SARC_05363 [Sphaeroforma arctica JP610]|eukprot:XP_014156250.1 hypothetical protein SARC_05363 [Sphaeroforma arctica JP610]
MRQIKALKEHDAFEDIDESEDERVEDSELEADDEDAIAASKDLLKQNKQQYEALVKQLRKNAFKGGQHGSRWLVPLLRDDDWFQSILVLADNVDAWKKGPEDLKDLSARTYAKEQQADKNQANRRHQVRMEAKQKQFQAAAARQVAGADECVQPAVAAGVTMAVMPSNDVVGGQRLDVHGKTYSYAATAALEGSLLPVVDAYLATEDKYVRTFIDHGADMSMISKDVAENLGLAVRNNLCGEWVNGFGGPMFVEYQVRYLDVTVPTLVGERVVKLDAWVMVWSRMKQIYCLDVGS